MMRGARRAPSVRDMEPWQPAKPRFRPFRVILGWAVAAAAIWVTAAILPGFALDSTGAAFLGAAVIALINAVLPPVLAALRLPFMLATGFLLVLAANAAALMIARDVFPDDIHVGSFGDALLAALLIAAVTMVLDVVLGTNDDDEYSLRVTRRIARRGGGGTPTAVPGHRLPRDRRPRPAGAARRDARRQRARTWPAGSPRTATGWPSGRPTCRRRPARARRGSCSARTRTSPRSAGSRRSRAGS